MGNKHSKKRSKPTTLCTASQSNSIGSSVDLPSPILATLPVVMPTNEDGLDATSFSLLPIELFSTIYHSLRLPREPLQLCCKSLQSLVLAVTETRLCRFAERHPAFAALSALQLLGMMENRLIFSRLTPFDEICRRYRVALVSDGTPDLAEAVTCVRGFHWRMTHNASCWTDKEYQMDRCVKCASIDWFLFLLFCILCFIPICCCFVAYVLGIMH
jgi:hypothetical protein